MKLKKICHFNIYIHVLLIYVKIKFLKFKEQHLKSNKIKLINISKVNKTSPHLLTEYQR